MADGGSDRRIYRTRRPVAEFRNEAARRSGPRRSAAGASGANASGPGAPGTFGAGRFLHGDFVFRLYEAAFGRGLSFAVPVTAASVVIETILAKLVLKEHVTPMRWAGACFVACGVALLAV